MPAAPAGLLERSVRRDTAASLVARERRGAPAATIRYLSSLPADGSRLHLKFRASSCWKGSNKARYSQVRHYAPAFLDVLELRAAPAARSVLDAGDVLRAMQPVPHDDSCDTRFLCRFPEWPSGNRTIFKKMVKRRRCEKDASGKKRPVRLRGGHRDVRWKSAGTGG
jgi:hypothetical protein